MSNDSQFRMEAVAPLEAIHDLGNGSTALCGAPGLFHGQPPVTCPDCVRIGETNLDNFKRATRCVIELGAEGYPKVIGMEVLDLEHVSPLTPGIVDGRVKTKRYGTLAGPSLVVDVHISGGLRRTSPEPLIASAEPGATEAL